MARDRQAEYSETNAVQRSRIRHLERRLYALEKACEKLSAKAGRYSLGLAQALRFSIYDYTSNGGSYRSLATAAGVDVNSISRFMRDGDLRIATAEKIAGVLRFKIIDHKFEKFEEVVNAEKVKFVTLDEQ
ncbi:hypothetical protein [Planctomicrobium piriforme]|nr:hypothetical protein [Planctomicrobium piriforme]